MKTNCMTRPHVAPWLADYASGSLDPAWSLEIEAHFLVCDVCFAAYLSQVLNESNEGVAETPA